MNNLFFIESPIQLSSALSAKSEFSGYNYLLLKRGSKKREKNYSQISGLVNNADWHRVIEIKNFDSAVLNHFYMLLLMTYLFAKFRYKTTRVFIGDYRNFYFVLYSRLIKPIEEVLLDDGTIIIVLQYNYFSKGLMYEDICKGYFNKHIIKILSKLNFNDDRNIPNIYSIFDLNNILYVNQKNYRLKNTPISKVFSNDIYFFGSKYSECNIISLENEIALLKECMFFIRTHYKNRNIYYLPHRDDSSSKKNKICEIGYIIKDIDCSAELYFDSLDVIPSVITGFYTTVLYSLSVKFKFEDVISFDLMSCISNYEDKSDAKLIYDYFKDVKIDIEEISLV